MKLRTFRVCDFRSVRDSGEVRVEDGQTCLVGKNESGKTALLQALYRTNPVVDSHGRFDPVSEFPKDDAADYIVGVEDGVGEDALVVECTYELGDEDAAKIADSVGAKALLSRMLTHRTYYNKPDADEKPGQKFDMELDDGRAMRFLVDKLGLDQERRRAVSKAAASWDALNNAVGDLDVQSEEGVEAIRLIQAVAGSADGLVGYVVGHLIWSAAPKFMYFDEYYQIRGGENLKELMDRERYPDRLQSSDYPLLGFIRLAGTEPEKLLNTRTTEDLRNRLGSAGRRITRKIVKYWSQNRHLEVEFDVRHGQRDDPEGMRDEHGKNIWALVRDTVHGSVTEIDKRSRGFVWFFSFLAWYGYLKRTHGSGVILLLDEPGLSLHGKAQHDLQRYFAEELAEHQVIYSTHSPFMLNIDHPERLRVVQDKSIDADELPSGSEDGTKVVNDLEQVWTTSNHDTLFPLLTAMGIELWQMDIVGRNRLIVEGKSDKDYIEGMSAVLEREQRTGLSRRWLVAQAGGQGRVAAIVSVFDAQKGLNVAVLLDVDTENENKIGDLYKKKLLKKKNVRKVSEFTGTAVADMEDMFDRGFYVGLVNKAYGGRGPALDESELGKEPRLVKAVEAAWKRKGGRSFSHGRPARYFVLHPEEFSERIPDATKDRFERMFESLNSLLTD